MRFKLEIDMANAAFEEGVRGHELTQCLARVAARVELGETEGRVRDTKGNTVGTWTLTEHVRLDSLNI
jgi:hypothetical protein